MISGAIGRWREFSRTGSKIWTGMEKTAVSCGNSAVKHGQNAAF
jgi:hypothetical protein